MQTRDRIISTISIAAAFLVGAIPAAIASNDDVSHLWQLHNQQRADAGIPQLTLDPDLSKNAQAHANEMAANHSIYHSGPLSQSAGQYNRRGENVGVDSTVDKVFNDFLNSPEHRDNIFDPGFQAMGAGVTYGDDDMVYVSVLYGGSHVSRHSRAAARGFTPAPVPAAQSPGVVIVSVAAPAAARPAATIGRAAPATARGPQTVVKVLLALQSMESYFDRPSLPARPDMQ